MVRWAYFLHDQELIDVYKECGGKVGTFDVDNPDDLCHARRAIFEYLMPGRVRIWYASLDGKDGMVFFVGKPIAEVRKAISRDLARRCLDMFERPPNPCIVVADSLNLKWDLISRDKTTHRLHLLEFMQSDRMGDMYPLTPEELALFPSEDE